MKKCVLCLMLALIILLCGCFGGSDINDTAIVMGVGFDSGDGEYYKSTVQTVVPAALSGGGGETYSNFEGEGKSIGGSILNASLKCGKYMNMSHTSALVINEKLAEKGVNDILDYFMRDKEFHSTITVAVSEESAERILQCESKIEKVPSSNIISLGRRFRENSLGEEISVFDFLSKSLEKNSAVMVPIVKSAGDDISVSGSAVFKDGKMTAKISTAEARGVLWLKNKIEKADITVEAEGATLDVRIENSRTKLKLLNNDEIYFTADIDADVSLKRDNKGVLNAWGEEKVCSKINEMIKSEILASLNKMQEMELDVYGFGEKISKKYPDKNKAFKDIKVYVNVKSKLRD